MKFLMSNFKELSYNKLLVVNGGAATCTGSGEHNENGGVPGKIESYFHITDKGKPGTTKNGYSAHCTSSYIWA